MALERIPPLTRTQAAPATRSAVYPASPATTGDGRMQLVVAESPAGELLGRSTDGRNFKLGTATTAPFVPGQVLMVRIVRTTPTLELMVLGGAQSHAGGLDGFGDLDGAGADPRRFTGQSFLPDTEPAALQTDQAAMRRLTRSIMEPPVLASSWRTLVLSHLQRSGTVPAGPATSTWAAASPYFAHEQAALQLPVSSLASAAPEESAARSTRFADALLVLRVQAWSELPLTLWLVPRGGPYQGTNRRSARRNGVRLRLSMQHPAWGPIGIEVDVLDATVALTLTGARAEAIAPLRDSVNAILQRLIACGLRLVRCRVEQTEQQEPNASPSDHPTQMAHARGPGTLTAAHLPLVLFRAATEVLAALSPPSR